MEQLITIKTYTYPHEVYVERGKLESEGIETFLKDETTVQVYNFYSNAVGGIKLQVFSEDVNRALAILDSVKETVPKLVVFSKKEIENTSVCPFCGSDNIGKKKNANWLTLIPYLLVGFILPVYGKSYLCFDCDKRWRIKLF
ncbi:MAG TPA: hypothetical protein DEQ06_03810 [Porphyromonadaceae bacterium]|nr:hypothetical protein [Porphyromonadaceae bacterium]